MIWEAIKRAYIANEQKRLVKTQTKYNKAASWHGICSLEALGGLILPKSSIRPAKIFQNPPKPLPRNALAMKKSLALRVDMLYPSRSMICGPTANSISQILPRQQIPVHFQSSPACRVAVCWRMTKVSTSERPNGPKSATDKSNKRGFYFYELRKM